MLWDKRLKIRAGLIFGIMLLFVGCDDQPTEIIMPDNINISVTSNRVVPVPSYVDPILVSIFSRYTKIIAPNGKPIHIFAQSEVSDQQIIRARDILEFYLTDVPDSTYGRNKSVVANAMANRSASLLFFNNESSRKHAFEEFSLADLNLASQNLHATQFFVEGSIDYANNPPDRQDTSFKDILHLVQKYGIIPSLPDYQSEIQTSANSARSTGIWTWTATDSNSTAQGYYATVAGVYYGLWADDRDGTVESWWGKYQHNTRLALQSGDPAGYNLITRFFSEHLTYTAKIHPRFSGIFYLSLKPQLQYTYKSQYLIHAALTGTDNSHLVGNGLANTLQGNSGNNRLDGGKGIDTAVFKGNYADYTIFDLREIEGKYVIMDKVSGRDGTDTLVDIEFIKFRDQTTELPAD